MSLSYLEVTFRQGKAIAGYYYLPRRRGDMSVHSERREGGMVVDYVADGRAIGIELTSPSGITLAVLNAVLSEIDQQPATPDDLRPLMSAA
jgi:hypothetical protein